MLPTDQCFDTDDLGGAQVDVGLIDEEELVGIEGADEVGMQLAVVQGPATRVGPAG